LFGPLPRKYFPWKDWLAEKVPLDFAKIHNKEVFKKLHGAKFTVIGDAYSFGNFIGILMVMPMLGFLTRKLDGWVAPEAPVAVRAIGYVWLGSYYIMYGSSLGWTGTFLYLSGIPFLGVVLCAKVFGSRKEYGKVIQPGLANGKPSP
jgi:hypothetical protein